ncbi:hypothetical protein ACGFNU_21470 [Spirillospora sp. NPDC048911]|uniref:hypothetical protein n=1 Tax=Spirillospora sp. NPDC048911 TaxID=3364527 RepID=UPI00371DEE1F
MTDLRGHIITMTTPEPRCRRQHVELNMTLPVISPRDRVLIRDALGRWHPAIAHTAARYDCRHSSGRLCHSTIAVAGTTQSWEHPVNWPAEDVRLAGGEAP